MKKIPIGVHRAVAAGMVRWANESLAKKIQPDQFPDDGGHWWIEIGVRDPDGSWAATESYGWGPTVDRGGGKPMRAGEVVKLKRVPGRINQRGGTHDGHEGDPAPVSYYPAAKVDPATGYAAIRTNYEARVRDFARSFSGSWNWRFNWGKNCHTFINRLENALGLSDSGNAPLLADPRGKTVEKAITGSTDQALVRKFATLRGMALGDMLARVEEMLPRALSRARPKSAQNPYLDSRRDVAWASPSYGRSARPR